MSENKAPPWKGWQEKEEDTPIERDLRTIRKLLSLITIKIRQVEDKIRCGNL